MKFVSRFCAGAALPLVLMAHPAFANDDLVRGILGVGSAIIMNQAQQQQQRQQQERWAEPARPAGNSYRDQRYSPVARNAATDASPEARAARAEIQRRLNLLGFDAGEPDGVYGAQTRRAIAQFQQSIGRKPDGKLSRIEVSQLYAATGSTWPPPTAADGDGGGFPQLGIGATEIPQGTGGSFPALGAAPSEAAAPDAGFPQLGSAASAPAGGAGAFPALGAPAQGGAPSSAGAFPTLAAPGEGGQGAAAALPPLATPAQPSGSAFPTLGRPTVEEAALPKLATPPAASIDAPTLPALGAAPDPASFPSVAAQPAAEPPNNAMPNLASAPEQAGNATAPGAAQPAPQAGEPDRPTLDRELANTVYKDRARQPTVSGVSLGQSPKDAIGLLSAAGFSNCDETDLPVSCRRDTASLADAVELWWSKSDGIWAIRRTIAFKTPAPVDFVTTEFKSGYPELMASQRGVTSMRSCPGGSIPDSGLAEIVRRIAVVLDGEDQPVPDEVAGFARLCPLIFALAVDGPQAVTAVHMTFLDATPLIRRAAAAAEKLEADRKAQREKLAKDLKL